MLNAKLDEHLQNEAAAGGTGSEPAAPNHRDGYTKKTVITDTSQVELEIPRDRRGTFEPQLIAKYQRRFPGFDDKIISMYARGMSVRDIQGICASTRHLQFGTHQVPAHSESVVRH